MRQQIECPRTVHPVIIQMQRKYKGFFPGSFRQCLQSSVSQSKFRDEKSSPSFGASIYNAYGKNAFPPRIAANTVIIKYSVDRKNSPSSIERRINSITVTLSAIRTVQGRRTASETRESIRVCDAVRRQRQWWQQAWSARSTRQFLYLVAVHCVDDIPIQCLGDTVTLIVPIPNAREHKHMAGGRFLCGCHLLAGRDFHQTSHHVFVWGILGARQRSHAQKLYAKIEIQGERASTD